MSADTAARMLTSAISSIGIGTAPGSNTHQGTG
jgi:hypothetical protein